MTRPTCQKCGQAIAFGETYLHPNKTEYAHQECPRPLDKLGKALKRYVTPALVAALLLWPAEPVLAALLRYELVSVPVDVAQTPYPACGSHVQPSIQQACWVANPTY